MNSLKSIITLYYEPNKHLTNQLLIYRSIEWLVYVLLNITNIYHSIENIQNHGQQNLKILPTNVYTVYLYFPREDCKILQLGKVGCYID